MGANKNKTNIALNCVKLFIYRCNGVERKTVSGDFINTRCIQVLPAKNVLSLLFVWCVSLNLCILNVLCMTIWCVVVLSYWRTFE